MSGHALDLLATIRRHGGDVKVVAPDRLRVVAPPVLLPEFLEQVRAVKPELLTALAAAASTCKPVRQAQTAPALGPSWWRDLFTNRTFEWCLGERDRERAKRLAWGDLENEWHHQHGKRWPAWQCAGCEKPIGGLAALDLPDGNRVHFEPIDCLIRFGKRWRGDARKAFLAFGLEPPNLDGDQL
jgi:hypothetical protein